MRRLTCLAVLIGLPIAIAPATAAAQAPGGLTPLAGGGACFLTDPAGAGFPGCGPLSAGVVNPDAIATSPNSDFVYVASRDSNNSIVTFARAASGLLTRVPGTNGCVKGGVSDANCIGVPSLGRPFQLALSADGSKLFAPGDDTDAVTMFDRDALTGKLTFAACAVDDSSAGSLMGCTSTRTLNTPIGVATAGAHIYVAGVEGVTLLAIGAGGGLSQPAGAAGCADRDGAAGANVCMAAGGLPADGAFRLAVAPSGSAVYATMGSRSNFFGTGNGVVAFLRDGFSGSLTPVSGAVGGCANAGGTDGCQTAANAAGSRTVAVSPDGKFLYVSAHMSNAIQTFALQANGLLQTPAAAVGCVSHAAAAGCTAVGFLNGALDVVLSADGAHAYTLAWNSQSLRAFSRDAATGALTPTAARSCLKTPPAAAGCELTGPALTAAEAVAVTPDGGSVYTAATAALGTQYTGVAGYRRDRFAPSCADAARSIGFGQAVVLDLPCEDADGDLEIQIVAPPTGGTLSAVDQASRQVGFGSLPGFIGRTTFTYEGSGGGIETPVRTYTIDVAPPSCLPRTEIPGNGIDEDCNGSDAKVTKLTAINARLSHSWRARRTYSTVRRLIVRGVPSTATVRVGCKGKGCPFKAKRFRPRNNAVNLLKSFKNRKLRVGVTVEIRVTAPNRIGKVLTLKTRASKQPSLKTLCLPPGASKPTRC